VFDNPDMDDELDASLRVDTREPVEEGGRFKMVFVVNMALGMSVGKTAGQVAHASLGLYRKLAIDDQRYSTQLLPWIDEGYVTVFRQILHYLFKLGWRHSMNGTADL